MVLTDPFDYAAEDALMDAWIAARASVALPEFANPPGFGLAYSGPTGGRACTRSSPSERAAGRRARRSTCRSRSTGPYAAALLADQGASVIKVERPGIGDIARWVGVSASTG